VVGKANDAIEHRSLTPVEATVGILLASTSGAAILAHVFLRVPMVFTVPFVVMPTGAIIIVAILMRSRLYGKAHTFASQVTLGGLCGLTGTLFYDVVRPLLTVLIQFHYEPYKAIPIFGSLITHRPPTDGLAITMGWLYHAWNGITFGMMFALFRTRGGVISGIIWGIGLQILMFITYPHLLRIRWNDPAFMTVGLVGHGIWGAVLGYTVTKWSKNA